MKARREREVQKILPSKREMEQSAIDYFGEEILNNIVNHLYKVISALIGEKISGNYRSKSLDRFQRNTRRPVVIYYDGEPGETRRRANKLGLRYNPTIC